MAEDMFAQKGWICPKCGRVLAPSTMYCLWCCSDMKESITTTATPIPKWDTTPIKVGSGMIDSSGTGRSYFVKTSSISRDSHEISDTPQTDCDHKCVQTEVGCEKTDCAVITDTSYQVLDGWQTREKPKTTDCSWK